MKCQLNYEDLPSNLMEDYIQTLGEYWEAIPGVGFIETNIDTIDEVYTIIENINKILNKSSNKRIEIEASFTILDKLKDEDEPVLMIVFRPYQSMI